MDAFQLLLDYIWVPLFLGLVQLYREISDLRSRITHLESADTLTYREFVEEMEPMRAQLTAIAIKIGVVEERRKAQ